MKPTVPNDHYKHIPYSASTEERVYRFPSSADEAEREYMARDFYEDAKAGIVPWPCGHRTV